MARGKFCVECGSHVPSYMNYLCEEHWKEALNEKLDGEKKKEAKENGQVRTAPLYRRRR